MTKVIGYTALHYGRDYLAYAIQSIIDHIEEYHVIYSATGSHGHKANVPCPESRDELYAIASTVAGNKLRWHDGEWAHEGLQRDSIHQYAPDADVIIVLDSDEIWGEGLPTEAIKYALDGGVRHWRYRMVHYWRSFYRGMPLDPAYPIRVIVPKYVDGDRTFTGGRVASNWSAYERPDLSYWINHLGYAQRPEIVEYKQLTHGHRNEWRHDIDWFKDRYLANAQKDCHPVSVDYWNPGFVNPGLFMPGWMVNHPYAQMDLIK